MSEEVANKELSSATADRSDGTCESSRPINGNDGKVKAADHHGRDSNMSGYDSAGSYSDREASASGSESERSVHFEREEGDGQESLPVKKVDDDEDKKNPQYIPKRGTFYEHDDRTGDDVEDKDEVKDDKDSKKKVWQDKKERWSHDRFNDNEQAPKSRAELIAIYGYDIRNEDGPPKARRRRRYGRGPNKYTRNWEDVDAYGKPTVVRKPINKKSKNKNSTDSVDSKEDNPEQTSESETGPQQQQSVAQEEQLKMVEKEPPRSNKPEVIHDEKPPLAKPREPREQPSRTNSNQSLPQQNQQEKMYPSNKSARVGTGRISKPKREFSDSDYRGFTKSRQFKSNPQNRVANRGPMERSPNNVSKNSVHELEKDMSKMNIQENYKVLNVKHNNIRQGSVPPRLQGEQKGSKRYSSIRQRSLPETANPPFPQHSNYYGNEYNQQAQTSQPPPQPTIIPNNTIHASAAQLPQIPNPALASIPTQVPVTTAPILQGPPQYAPPFPPAPPFLQPGVPAASFIPPQTTPIINYGQPQYQAPFQGYQQQFGTVNQPTELYQPQGGITYYSTQEQQAAQRSVPQKRPKVAIPIVAPPEHRGRGRTTQQVTEVVHESPAEPTVEPNIEPEKFEDAVVAQ